jgi:glyoxylate/hydroxypyruvate reductase
MGQDIQGSTVGFVGLGGIGQAIAKRLIPFEVKKIIYSGHSPKPQGRHKGEKQE